MINDHEKKCATTKKEVKKMRYLYDATPALFVLKSKKTNITTNAMAHTTIKRKNEEIKDAINSLVSKNPAIKKLIKKKHPPKSVIFFKHGGILVTPAILLGSIIKSISQRIKNEVVDKD